MRTVHVMQGLPASGKSTLARRLVADSGGRLRRIGLDDLRHMLDSTGRETPWQRDRELSTERIQALIAREVVESGHDLVIDNTHLHPGQIEPVRAALAGLDVTWVVHDLTGVPLLTCVARDFRRARPVGEQAIRALHTRWATAAASGWRLTAEWLSQPVAA
jgi:predicted kinase